jgi:hypothetical protein
MKWPDIPLHPTTRVLRQFSAAWLVFLLAFGAHQHLARGHRAIGLAVMGLALVVGVAGLIKPAIVRWLFVGSMVLAFPIGWVVSQIMLSLMFYVVLTPVALIFRLCGRDMLQRKPAPERASYWLPKESPRNLRRYFRQY